VNCIKELDLLDNPILQRLPLHLKQFITRQNYKHYSAIDQAVWRYVMRRIMDHMKDLAHESYTGGVLKTGLTIDAIPNMEDMNRILASIGWAAVPVDGFIPPAAFMEFQAYNVLVIAADIRQLEHMEYTPAPDIIHEGAGHAPIIANPEYAEYIRRFGEVGCKAIGSARDFELYEAVRHLSIIKEAQGTTAEEIEAAENHIEILQENMGEASELAQIRNLHWWTVEYGLIGEAEDLKIYGAGLLSSIGESRLCLSDKVKKIPYTIAAAAQNFDITKPQPHLYYTPDFAHLSLVLEEFANKMALRTGGLEGLVKLIASNQLGSIELSTGLQVSGRFSRVITHEGKPLYFQTSGPTALALRDRELVGHGVSYHSEGFGSPLGKLKGINLAIEDMGPRDLMAYDIYEGKTTRIEFEGGVRVEGEVITGKRNLQGKIVLISFQNCTVTYGDEILFAPEWGVYDMAVGKKVISAFSGPADPSSFDLITHIPSEKTIQKQKSEKRLVLESLYQQCRDLRETGNRQDVLETIFDQLKENHPEDWLLALELYELSEDGSTLQKSLGAYLARQMESIPGMAHLIENGMHLIKSQHAARA
jgi:phenylalanine-4-hydroxylase